MAGFTGIIETNACTSRMVEGKMSGINMKDLVTQARTCRRYDGGRELGAQTLSDLVDSARKVPSAGNAQVLRYITVHTAEKRAAFYPALIWAAALKDWNGPEEGERPGGYILILGPKGNDGKVSPHTWIDLGIAAQTIQLAAHAQGIGACMFRSFKPDSITAVLPVPEGLEVLLPIALGYPVEQRRLVQMGADGSVKYYRDAEGVHYVPKRDLGEVLIGQF